MAERIGVGTGAGEIAVLDRRVQVEVAVFGEVRMRAVDAGVDDRPDDAVAERGKGGRGGVGCDRGDRAVGERFDREVGPDPVDRAVAGAADRASARMAGRAASSSRTSSSIVGPSSRAKMYWLLNSLLTSSTP